MNKKKASLLAISGVTTASLATIGFLSQPKNSNEYSAIFQSSLYLKDKSRVPCTEDCVELEKGYLDAETSNDCTKSFSTVPEDDYNLGIFAWAWDNCAYSNDGEV